MEAVVPPKLQQLEMIETIYQTIRGYVTGDNLLVVTAMRTPNNSSLHVKRRSDKKTSHEADKLVSATSCGAANTVVSTFNSCAALAFTALASAEVRNDTTANHELRRSKGNYVVGWWHH
jgi:hypothetical protein